MNRYLLDTSVVIAHFLGDEKAVHLVDRLAGKGSGLSVCVVTWLEFDTNLKARGVPDLRRQEIVEKYRQSITYTWVVGDAVVQAATFLKGATPTRLPAMDSLIAGCAKVNDAILVHRDKHMSAIPESALKTIHLDGTDESSVDAPPAVRETSATYRTRRIRRKSSS